MAINSKQTLYSNTYSLELTSTISAPFLLILKDPSTYIPR
jgi:hypothetical protein